MTELSSSAVPSIAQRRRGPQAGLATRPAAVMSWRREGMRCCQRRDAAPAVSMTEDTAQRR
jgi:hypothetical protein